MLLPASSIRNRKWIARSLWRAKRDKNSPCRRTAKAAVLRTALVLENKSNNKASGHQEQTSVKIPFAALLRHNTCVARSERWHGWVRCIKTEGFVLMTKPSVFCITCRSLGFPECGWIHRFTRQPAEIPYRYRGGLLFNRYAIFSSWLSSLLLSFSLSS